MVDRSIIVIIFICIAALFVLRSALQPLAGLGNDLAALREEVESLGRQGRFAHNAQSDVGKDLGRTGAQEDPATEIYKGAGKKSHGGAELEDDVNAPATEPKGEDAAAVAAIVTETVECLKKHGSYKDGCWWNLRRETFFEVLRALSELPTSELEEFSFANSGKTEGPTGDFGWHAMDLLVPTYECNFNHLRKMMDRWICGNVQAMISDAFAALAKQGLKPTNGTKTCVVYSVGSQGNFQFEESIAKEFGGNCEIHTFDCSGEWTNPTTTFHNWCLGAKPGTGIVSNDNFIKVDGDKYRTLAQITTELQHKAINILKFDIEGYEYGLFESLLTEENSPVLPLIIFAELHTHLIPHLDEFLPESYKKDSNWVRPLYSLAKKLDEFGYVLVAKERNEWGPAHSKCCSEYLWMRLKSVPGMDLTKIPGFGRKWRTHSGQKEGEAATTTEGRLGFVEAYAG